MMAENNCVVCFKNVRIYSVGECDHPVCYECSTRMRVLCGQNECPMCRHEMEKVVFTERIRPFRRLKKHYVLYDDKFHIAFENDYIREMFERLLHYVCQKCTKQPIFDTFQTLNDHMKRAHDSFCCDLCAENLKIFPFERRYYSKIELNRHKRIGDVDDRSHRGHPLCEFCNVRYVDRDELYRHLRKEHLFCHICDSEGIQQFYGMYETLRDHYKRDHFLCEEGDCIKEQFTSVFPTELDLKAHKALVHCKNLRNKQAIKQARTLDLEFNLAPRTSNDRRRMQNQECCEEEMTSHRAANNQTPENNENKMATWEQDFPSLTNATTYSAPRPKFTKESSNKYAFNEQNFPALGSETNIRVSVTSVDNRPSTSSATNSSTTSVKLNHNKAKSKNTREPSRNGVSASPMLSLTWVEKAKEKKPPPTNAAPASVPAEGVVRPPPMSRKNFPKLQNQVGESSVESPKKSKATVENDGQRSKVNYSEVINNKNKSEEKKSSNGGKSKEKSNNDSCSSKDSKSHGFLLNANRKKVKMKPEMFTNLNAHSSRSDSLPKQSSNGSVPRYSAKSHPEPSKSKGSNTPVQRNNCDSSVKQIKTVEKKKEKSSNLGQVKEKGGKGKENVTAKIENDEKSGLQNGIEHSNQLNIVAKSTKSDQKTKRTKKKTESNDKPLSDVNGMVDPFESIANNDGFANVRAPPGFDKLAIPPPPGIGVLTNGCKNAVGNSSTNSLLNFFLFQEPNNFAQRNADLSEKIKRSLKKRGKGTLDEFKNTSLLFQEGYITASIFYGYCRENIDSDDFDDVFVDLVTLLPNILKQQELWAVHKSMVPSSLSISLITSCPVCFQLLKLEDTVSHYSQHSSATDMLLQNVGIS